MPLCLEGGRLRCYVGALRYGGDSSAVSVSCNRASCRSFPPNAFAALKEDGSVVTWGYLYSGGDSRSVSAELQSGVTQIFSTSAAFAALKEDGSVVTWGNSAKGGDGRIWGYESCDSCCVMEMSVQSCNLASRRSFPLQRLCRAEGGRLCCHLGRSEYGGDSSAVSSELNPAWCPLQIRSMMIA